MRPPKGLAAPNRLLLPLELLERDIDALIAKGLQCALQPALTDHSLEIAELAAGQPEQRQVRAAGVAVNVPGHKVEEPLLAGV